MRRLAVVATARDAYAFIGAQMGAIIALIWLPAVLITVAQFFTFSRCLNGLIDAMASSNSAHLGPVMLMLMGYWVAQMLLFALMLGGVVQLAQGGRPSAGIAYLTFGPAEWRMFRAFCGLAGFLLLASMFVTACVNMALAANKGAGAQNAGSLVLLALAAAGGALAARFLLLTPAIAVGETVPVLRRAWSMSIGQFWSLLGVLVLLFLPVMAASMVLELGFGSRPAPSPDAAAKVQMIALVLSMRQILPLICGLSFLMSPLIVGLLAGASVSAWRSLKGDQQLDVTV